MKAVYNISYGLYVLTAKTEKHNGCITNTLCQVTTNPNRVTVTVNKQNFTTNQILQTKKFNVSILDDSTNLELIKRFGFVSGKDTDKFDGFLDWAVAENGISYITSNTNSYITCSVIEEKDLGTHIQFLADVTGDYVLGSRPSITYAYYQSNFKPRPVSKKTVYVCSVCGYVYEGEELPKDFICPLCKHDASYFEKKEKSDSQSKVVEEKDKILVSKGDNDMKSKKYVCPVCGYVYEGENPPEKCPLCGASLKEVNEDEMS